MAEMPEPRRFDIALVPGMDRSSPAHFLHREGGVSFTRVLNNLRPDRGELARRPGLVAVPDPPTLDRPGPWKVIHIQELNIDPNVASRFFMATERELFIGSPGAWTNVTPVHSTGTVTVTNGSPTVTGVGTAWFDRGIYGGAGNGNWFRGPDNAWYEISAVASNTSLTLTTNYAGANAGPGAAYLIRRTIFLGTSGSAGIFTQRINADLYVAGNVAGGNVSGGNLPDGGVLKIPNAFSAIVSSWAATDTAFLTAGRNEVEVGVDYLGDNLVVRGFGALADGRLVVAGSFYNTTSAVSGSATVYYSSHLNVAVWTLSPGGFTDLIDFQGAISAASISTDGVAIHFEDGIESGELTGQDDPPLRFRPSKASVGAIGARMLAKVPAGAALPGREVFVGADSRLYAWNGLDAAPIDSSGLTHELTHEANEAVGIESALQLRSGFLLVDGARNEIAIFAPVEDASPAVMRELRWSYQDGSLWRGSHRGRLFCGAVLRRSGLDGPLSPPLNRLVLGTETDTSWLWRSSEAASSDGYTDGADAGGIYGIWDGIDGGRPETWKTTQEILVYLKAPFHATAAATTLKLRWYTDSTPAGEELTATVTPARTQYEQDFLRPEYLAIFNKFATKPWRTLSFVLASNDDNVFAATISRISLFYAEHGDARAL